jgi:predicted  nucleic acid-binding Zn-ribbon protein
VEYLLIQITINEIGDRCHNNSSVDGNVKDNFEELLTALSIELHTSNHDRDNLRDEVVPQIQARVEGLEAQAAEHDKLANDHTKMQQQMQSSRNDNVHKLQADISSIWTV